MPKRIKLVERQYIFRRHAKRWLRPSDFIRLCFPALLFPLLYPVRTLCGGMVLLCAGATTVCMFIAALISVLWVRPKRLIPLYVFVMLLLCAGFSALFYYGVN